MQNRRGVLSVLLLCVLYGSRAFAWACPSDAYDPASVVARAEVLIVARALTTTRRVGRDQRVTRFRIDRILRGARLHVGQVLAVGGCYGSKCGRDFTRGHDYLVHAYYAPRGSVEEIGSCGITRELGSPQGDALIDQLTRLTAGTTSQP